MKEYQRHIESQVKGKSLCGEDIFDWSYVDVDHAFLSIPRDRIQPCPKCAKVVIDVFKGAE